MEFIIESNLRSAVLTHTEQSRMEGTPFTRAAKSRAQAPSALPRPEKK